MDTLMLELSKPFSAKHITWKPGATTKDKTKAMAMPYADTRAYQKRLDDVCGFNWSCEYQPWGDTRIVCELTINGVTRSATGEGQANDGNCGTSAEAQAFKRACSAFGLGRFLYEMPAPWVPLNGKYISDEEVTGLRRRYQAWAEKKLAALAAKVSDEGE